MSFNLKLLILIALVTTLVTTLDELLAAIPRTIIINKIGL
jgi:hypothetical protein